MLAVKPEATLTATPEITSVLPGYVTVRPTLVSRATGAEIVWLPALSVKPAAAVLPFVGDALGDDPFDGKPFRYALAKGLVYSVGENLTDDGGSAESTEPGKTRPKDLVYALDAATEGKL